MKRSNDKQLKIEHELCLRVCIFIAFQFKILLICLSLFNPFAIE